MEPFSTWEGVARWIVEECGLDEPPIEPREVAVCWGLRVVSVSSRHFVCVTADTLYVNNAVTRERLRNDVAHEMAHRALLWAGEEESERAAAYVGAAILCPRAALLRDLARHRWDLEALTRAYEVSWELLARRITEVRSAVACVFDNGRLTRRLVSPWLAGAVPERPTAPELHAASAAAEGAAHVHDGGLSAYAVPRVRDDHQRIVTVARASVLPEQDRRSDPPPAL